MDGSDPDVYVNSEMVKGIPHLYDSPEQNLKLEYKVRVPVICYLIKEQYNVR